MKLLTKREWEVDGTLYLRSVWARNKSGVEKWRARSLRRIYEAGSTTRCNLRDEHAAGDILGIRSNFYN